MSEPEEPLPFAESAAEVLLRAARTAHPLETGGLLLGVLTQGRPWVTHAVEIPTSDRGRAHYRLPAGTTRAAVRAARAADPRLGYLGDWHSHPADVGPSPTDKASLLRLALLPRLAAPPLLVIVRASGGTAWLHLQQAERFRLRERPLMFTGDLPPAVDRS